MTKLLNISKILIIILVILISIFFTPLVASAEEEVNNSEKDEIKNPFYDYRKNNEVNEEKSEKNTNETENNEENEMENLVNDLFEEEGEENEGVTKDKTEQEVTYEVKTGYQNTETTNKIIEIKNKRIEPDFYWQGLISVQGRYQLIFDYESQSHILSVGDTLNGYQVINIDSAKVTLAKDNYIYYLNMRGE